MGHVCRVVIVFPAKGGQSKCAPASGFNERLSGAAAIEKHGVCRFRSAGAVAFLAERSLQLMARRAGLVRATIVS